jgi:hypothetical protein
MKAVQIISGCICLSLMSGCATMPGAQGPHGPKLVGSGQSTEYEHYAQVGVEFSSMGDFVALVSPTRWKSPIATGGSLSWMNPVAWSEDPGRTGRIFLGEAVIVGGAVAAASAGGGGGSDGGTTGDTVDPFIGSPPSLPPVPPE